MEVQRPFSQFVRDRVWNRLTCPRMFAVSLDQDVLGPAQVDFLLEHFREGWRHGPRLGHKLRTYELTTLWSCCLYSQTATVLIEAYGDPSRDECLAEWDLSADSTEELYDLLKRLWPVLGSPERSVAQASWWEDVPGLVEGVLSRLREEFGKAVQTRTAQEKKQ
jgi:hypothetical protein